MGIALCVAALPASALAASPPTIEGESASNITQLDATLEAQIDPQGLETTYKIEIGQPPNYEFVIGCKPPGPGEVSCLWLALVTHVKEGTISGTSGEQSVSVDLNEASAWLEPSTTYHFRVVATSSAGTTEGPDRTFTTPPTGNAPVIESVSLSHLTPTDATLEAKINTEGQATIYQFHMWSSCAHEACESLRAIPLPPGSLLGSFVSQSVSLDLNSVGVTLKSGEEYGWGVTATHGLEHTSANGEVFEPLSDVVEPLGPTVTPGPKDTGPATSNDTSQSPGAGSPSPTTLGTSSTLGTSLKTAAGTTGGKPKVSRGKHHKHKRHGKAAKHLAKSKKRKR